MHVNLKDESLRALIPLAIAMTFGFLSYWLLNQYLFPLFDTVLAWSREISAVSGGAILITLALIASRKPEWYLRLDMRMATAFTVLIGAVILICGIWSSSIALLVIGSIVSTVGTSVSFIIVGMAGTDKEPAAVGCCVAIGYLLSYALRFAFLPVSSTVGVLAFILSPLLAMGLVWKQSGQALSETFSSEPISETTVTKPSTFLPFGHQLFVSLLLFRVVYGFLLTFNESARTPLLTVLPLVPLAICVLIVLLRRRTMEPDVLFQVTILFVTAGFLILPTTIGEAQLASGLLSSGVGLFEILMLFVLIELGHRNKAGAFVALAWGNAMASLGTIIGANLGRLTNFLYNGNPHGLAITVGAVVFGIVIYLLFVFRTFSFSGTMREITSDAQVVTSLDAQDIDEICSDLSRQYGLTAREAEVFALLARGRNSRFLQKTLVLSRNTIKTHVHHIYQKLDVHNQQELINLVEDKKPQ